MGLETWQTCTPPSSSHTIPFSPFLPSLISFICWDHDDNGHRSSSSDGRRGVQSGCFIGRFISQNQIRLTTHPTYQTHERQNSQSAYVFHEKLDTMTWHGIRLQNWLRLRSSVRTWMKFWMWINPTLLPFHSELSWEEDIDFTYFWDSTTFHRWHEI